MRTALLTGFNTVWR